MVAEKKKARESSFQASWNADSQQPNRDASKIKIQKQKIKQKKIHEQRTKIKNRRFEKAGNEKYLENYSKEESVREREGGFLGEGEKDEREARAIAKHHERACRFRRTKIGFTSHPSSLTVEKMRKKPFLFLKNKNAQKEDNYSIATTASFSLYLVTHPANISNAPFLL